jgi:hypothetical protein
MSSLFQYQSQDCNLQKFNGRLNSNQISFCFHSHTPLSDTWGVSLLHDICLFAMTATIKNQTAWLKQWKCVCPKFHFKVSPRLTPLWAQGTGSVAGPCLGLACGYLLLLFLYMSTFSLLLRTPVYSYFHSIPHRALPKLPFKWQLVHLTHSFIKSGQCIK